MPTTFLGINIRIASVAALTALCSFPAIAAGSLAWVDALKGAAAFAIGPQRYRIDVPAEVVGLYLDSEIHRVGHDEYVSAFLVEPSNLAAPQGRCGAGREIIFVAYQLTGNELIARTRVTVSSCLRNIDLKSLNTGDASRDDDFSSVQWNARGFSIDWFAREKGIGREPDVTEYIRDGNRFAPVAIASQLRRQ